MSFVFKDARRALSPLSEYVQNEGQVKGQPLRYPHEFFTGIEWKQEVILWRERERELFLFLEQRFLLLSISPREQGRPLTRIRGAFTV